MTITAADIAAAFDEAETSLEAYARTIPFTDPTRNLLLELAEGKHADALRDYAAQPAGKTLISKRTPNKAARNVEALRTFAGLAVAYDNGAQTMRWDDLLKTTYTFSWRLLSGDVTSLAQASLVSPNVWKLAVEGCNLAGRNAYEIAMGTNLMEAAIALRDGSRSVILDPDMDVPAEYAHLYEPHETMFEHDNVSCPPFAARLVAIAGLPKGATVKTLGGLSANAIAEHLGISAVGASVLDSIAENVEDEPLIDIARTVGALCDEDR